MTKDDMVLEIGPGIGTMTQYLAEAAGKVVAVEIDRNLLPILQETLADYDNVKVIHADVLSLDLEKLVQEENGGRPIKVVAICRTILQHRLLWHYLSSMCRWPM